MIKRKEKYRGKSESSITPLILADGLFYHGICPYWNPSPFSAYVHVFKLQRVQVFDLLMHFFKKSWEQQGN